MILCPSCRGLKTYSTLGGMLIDCEMCNRVGYIQDKKPHDDEQKEAKKVGRPKKQGLEDE